MKTIDSVSLKINSIELSVVLFSGKEALSSCFTFSIDCVSTESLDSASLLGQAAELKFNNVDLTPIHYKGYISFSADLTSFQSSPPIHRIVFVSTLYKLSYSRSTGILSDINIFDYTRQMLDDSAIASIIKCESRLSSLQRNCIQPIAGETQFQLFSRIWDEAGYAWIEVFEPTLPPTIEFVPKGIPLIAKLATLDYLPEDSHEAHSQTFLGAHHISVSMTARKTSNAKGPKTEDSTTNKTTTQIKSYEIKSNSPSIRIGVGMKFNFLLDNLNSAIAHDVIYPVSIIHNYSLHSESRSDQHKSSYSNRVTAKTWLNDDISSTVKNQFKDAHSSFAHVESNVSQGVEPNALYQFIKLYLSPQNALSVTKAIELMPYGGPISSNSTPRGLYSGKKEFTRLLIGIIHDGHYGRPILLGALAHVGNNGPVGAEKINEFGWKTDGLPNLKFSDHKLNTSISFNSSSNKERVSFGKYNGRDRFDVKSESGGLHFTSGGDCEIYASKNSSTYISGNLSCKTFGEMNSVSNEKVEVTAAKAFNIEAVETVSFSAKKNAIIHIHESWHVENKGKTSFITSQDDISLRAKHETKIACLKQINLSVANFGGVLSMDTVSNGSRIHINRSGEVIIQGEVVCLNTTSIQLTGNIHHELKGPVKNSEYAELLNLESPIPKINKSESSKRSIYIHDLFEFHDRNQLQPKIFESIPYRIMNNHHKLVEGSHIEGALMVETPNDGEDISMIIES